MSKRCPYAKSDMTPCYLQDGEIGLADDGVCVGCGRAPDALTSEGETCCSACGVAVTMERYPLCEPCFRRVENVPTTSEGEDHEA